MPIGPTAFKDGWKMGFGFGGGVGLQFNPQIEASGKFYYNTFGFDWDKLIGGASGVSGDGADFQAIEFGVDLKYMFAAGGQTALLKPYVVLGGGFVNVKFTDATITGGTTTYMIPFSGISETKINFSGGAGLDYMMSPQMGIWVEGRFLLIATEGESISFLPIRAGIKFLLGQ